MCFSQNDDATLSLWSAVNNRSLKGVKEALELGAGINDKLIYVGETALHSASAKGYIEIAKFLLENGANVNVTDIIDETPLMYALKECKTEMVNFLIGNKADVNYSNGDKTVLNTACSSNKVELVKLVIERGAIVKTGALHCTFWSNSNIRIAKFLINNGADVDETHAEYDYILHDACRENNIEWVKLLVESGADINIKTDFNGTPLHTAIDEGNLDIVKFLVKSGAKINELDDFDRTPLDLARESDSKDIIDFLEVFSNQDSCRNNVDKVEDIDIQNGVDKDIKVKCQDCQSQDDSDSRITYYNETDANVNKLQDKTIKDQLLEYKELLDLGMIDEKEFKTIRKKILDL